MLHVAWWAHMGCYPRVTPTLTLISLWLMAQWACISTWPGSLVGVWGLPLTVCNSQFWSGASDGTLLSEGMTWLCFLSSADVKTGEVRAMSAAKAWITDVGLYGTMVSWDSSMYTFVMIASV